ncbi:hypothetical protein DV736_g2773, partial [Chaetothyriales sp. CBS 134916]
MKFGREIEDDLVPEWKTKYFDYKKSKKLIKEVSRALREANKTPSYSNTGTAETQQAGTIETSLPFTHFDFNQRSRPPTGSTIQSEPLAGHGEEEEGQDPRVTNAAPRESQTLFARSPVVMIPGSQGYSPEETPLRSSVQEPRLYGSFVGTPPEESPLRALELPGPAMSTHSSKRHQGRVDENFLPRLPQSCMAVSDSSGPYQLGPTQGRPSFAKRLLAQQQHYERTMSAPAPRFGTSPRSRLHKLFKPHQLQSPRADNVQLDSYEKLDARQADFFAFLDKELNKIEEFYKTKEDEATERLAVLRRQLHELRDRRLNEIEQARRTHEAETVGTVLQGDTANNAKPLLPKKQNGVANRQSVNPLKKFEEIIHKGPKIGRVTKSLQQHTSPAAPLALGEDRGDYVRRHDNAPSYRVAKRRLKLALQEFYRGLELLKSYTLLNKTAFRKANKKYDKAVNARPTLQYYSSKVEKAYFVKSDLVSGHMVAVEDLYARYFEKGSHKAAVSKLRSKLKGGDYSGVAFRTGLYVAAGTCFAAAGLKIAVGRLFHPNPDIGTETSYLLHLYAGYFLALLLFLLFVLDCKIWTAFRINYQFIFEYDPRHTLNYHQLAELPCFFLLLNGLFLYLNFQQDSGSPFYRYWFVLLIGITFAILALPFKVLYFQSRWWWGYSNWRLFFAGLYPVEFRDFYLGDMYCSATYSTSNIELFFCLYGNDWINPNLCNSGHSRLMGFFAALPAIWRALQCIRRYKDSGNWFPHLANFTKYMGNVIYYVTLSMYRINHGWQYKTAFIVFATINGLYCSVWDIFMDWSLGNWWCENIFLRGRLAYKEPSYYYAAMVADVVLRHQWIAYAVFTEAPQHRTVVSFIVALAEVLRRGMWSLFRVENEHCNNVDNYRASRDIPLPYKLEQESDVSRTSQEQQQGQTQAVAPVLATGTDIEQQHTADSASIIRQRRQAQKTPTFRALQRVGTAIATAHAQDFEKKRRPVKSIHEAESEGGSSDEEDDGEVGDAHMSIGDFEDQENVQAVDKLVSRAERGSVA